MTYYCLVQQKVDIYYGLSYNMATVIQAPPNTDAMLGLSPIMPANIKAEWSTKINLPIAIHNVTYF